MTTIGGAYGVALCLDCGNDWSRYVLADPSSDAADAWFDYLCAQADFDGAIAKGERQFGSLIDRFRRQQFRMFEIADAWVKAGRLVKITDGPTG